MSFEVRLTKPIEELLPKSIDWNGAELMSVVKEELKKYEGKTYDDSSIAEAKADRAKLNNTIKMLDQMRLEVKREWNIPCAAFEAEVKSITEAIGAVNSAIDKQTKDYEARKQAEKQSQLEDYYRERAYAAELSGLIKYDIISNPRWMNATFTLDKCFAEIDAKITQIKNEIATIEALKSEDESTLKALYFRNVSLSSALTEHARLSDERKRVAAEAEARAARIAAATAQAQIKPEPQKEVAQQEIKIQQPMPEEPQKVYSVAFKVRGTETQIKALRAFLVDNEIYFEIIK